jgi:hypothetical protein
MPLAAGAGAAQTGDDSLWCCRFGDEPRQTWRSIWHATLYVNLYILRRSTGTGAPRSRDRLSADETVRLTIRRRPADRAIAAAARLVCRPSGS